MAKHSRGQRVPFAAIGGAAREDALSAYDDIIERIDNMTDVSTRGFYVESGDAEHGVVVDISGEVALKKGGGLYTQIPWAERAKILAKYGWMKGSGQRAVALRRRAGVGRQVRVKESVWRGGVPLGKPAARKKTKPYYEWDNDARAIAAARSAGYAPETAAEAIDALAWSAGYEQGARGKAADTSQPAKVPPKWMKRWAQQYIVGWTDGRSTRS